MKGGKKVGYLFLGILLSWPLCVSGQTVIDEWNAIKVPPAPQVKKVAVDPASTALLLLDFNKQTCNAQTRPRCISSIPKVQKLLERARAANLTVVYSLSAGAVPADIAGELAPRSGEAVVTSGPDKFLNTDLDSILRDKKIKTVIVTGTASHGAVLYTASEAAFRGMKVIVPVDGMSAEVLYAEQYVSWHLVNAPRVSAQTTLSRTDLITF
ncbi:MAG: cysteine hydrolase [Syntrophorhabdales bacterium]|jgi:nicotinamidase-related amidase